MSKTSSSHSQNQTQQQQLETSLATMQSPPLITNDQNDQKVEDGGVLVKIDDKGVVEDYDDIERKNMCIIDVKNEQGKQSVTSNNNDDDDHDHDHHDDEKVCRICQLRSYDHLPAGSGNVNLILLGCACRGELGISHYHCAFVWFQQKGNRTCEICGKPAKNIAGIEDTGFRVYATDIDIITSELARNSGSSETDHRYSRCLSKVLLAVVVLAFILPWAIRPNRLF